MSQTVPLLPGFEAHHSGVVWIPHSKTALIADVHLGYSWAQRRRGELGPLADERTREKLRAVCDDLLPSTIVFLGDLVHAPRPCAPEREWIEETLRELGERASLIAIRGNHDRAFAREFGHLKIATAESWCCDRVLAIHGDRWPLTIPEHDTLLLGHLHPALSVRDATGAAQKLALFLATSKCIVLPAFSPFARGYDVGCGLSEEFQKHFGEEAIQAYAASPTRVVSLGPLRRALERMFQADVHAPAQFRKRRAASQ